MTIDARQLLLLLAWMSPAFPVGSFAYSHGLEAAIETGDVRTADDLRQWIADLVSRGSGWNDAVIFSRCWLDDAAELNELALALASSRERHLETTQLGRAFRIAATVFASQAPSEDDIAYPVAAGVACRNIGIEKSAALLAFLQSFANTLVSVAVRLIPLGQTQGLSAIRDLMPVIAGTAERATVANLDDLGSITILSDIAAMNHETQRSRVFRT